MPQLPTLENLLNIFISNFGIEKLFLFDVVSKIYIATDSTPVDMQTYELCCDMMMWSLIFLVFTVSKKMEQERPVTRNQQHYKAE